MPRRRRRKQMRGLSVVVQEEVDLDLFSAHLFAFRNRRRLLQNGEKVVVSAIPQHAGSPEAEYVSVQRLAGRHTHTLCHRLSSYLPRGRLDLLTERALERLE